MNMKPTTTLSIKHYEITITAQSENEDTTVDELFEMFRRAMLGSTFTQDQFEKGVLNIAAEIMADQEIDFYTSKN
jgi:hypothetical protein